MRCFTAVLTVWLVVPFQTLLAQQQPPIQPGERVRARQECTEGYTRTSTDLTTICPTYVGVLIALARDSVELDIGDRNGHASLPLESLAQCEVSRGRHRSTVGAIGFGTLGLVGGAALGFGIGAAVATSSDCYEMDCIVAPAIGFLVGAPIGLISGVVYGARVRERWEDVPLDRLRVSVVPQRGGLTVGLRIAF